MPVTSAIDEPPIFTNDNFLIGAGVGVGATVGVAGLVIFNVYILPSTVIVNTFTPTLRSIV